MAVETRNFFPQLERHVTPTKSGSELVSYTSDLKNGGPILVLAHGYPQSICLQVVQNLLGTVSLFVPELPGWGVSSPAKEHTKVVTIFETEGTRNVILCGHDRGAGIVHRLTVLRHEFPSVNIAGTIILDIIPTKALWDKLSNPAISQAYFHWPLLANADLAVALLQSFGPGKWVRASLSLTGNEKGLQRILADGAVDAYAALFEKEEALRCSSAYFAAGAMPEYNDQLDDQKAGRKVDVPIMVMFSAAKMGTKIDVAKEWEDWITPGTPYES
ncbi:hypothetical protein GQ53DRAFT_792429 [Thozetella sp. PMI_491]|nr:hypothetical protein GQ53DRAFT_792429 [Thozetella sp. PMI_491]